MELMELEKGNSDAGGHAPPTRSNSNPSIGESLPPTPNPKGEIPDPQGAEMEVTLLADTDLPSFITTWVSAATTAEGKATTTCAELEVLESQGELIKLIMDATSGLAAKRKALQSLGANASSASVQTILSQACPFVLAYKKHVKVANNLISGHKKETQPKKKAKAASKAATLKVSPTHVSVLLRDVKSESVRARKRNASAKRRNLLRLATGKKKKAPLKKSKLAAPPPSRWQSWPVLMPYDVCKAIKASGMVKELLCGTLDPLAFWNQASHEDWGASHPVQFWDDDKKSRAYPVLKSDMMLYNEAGDNISLHHLQDTLVQSLNKCSDPNNDLGFTIHIVCGRGDWKWRHEWLKQTRFYGNAAGPNGLCQRCLASKTTWLDPVFERFNNHADLEEALATAVGDISLKNLAGWRSEMELPDLLHCCWLGSARDLNGSLCMRMASKFFGGATYDERLAELRKDMQLWCQNNGLSPSIIDEFSAFPIT
ncbi:unnamed protein product [Symbiodinium sp. CCMP2592]|nr:unnamed protein product [Symbiodinium sp. CCMP2592]